jgi:tetratricopeptide (TPR) repeat protein
MKPNDPAMYYSLGLIQRPQGRWIDALSNLRRAVKLDPTNDTYLSITIGSLTAIRQHIEAEALARSFNEEHPLNLYTELVLATTAFMASGSTAEMKVVSRHVVASSERSVHIQLQKYNAWLRGDWAEFIRFDREQRYYEGDYVNPVWSQDVTAAEVFAESGDMEGARTRATEAMRLIKAELERQPNNSQLWACLSLTHALSGEKVEALRSARRSAELMPESNDALLGPSNSAMCALALAWIGEKDRALAELERLLHGTNGVYPYWGVNIYQCRASWRPLQDDPRFKGLVSDPKNNEPESASI